MSDAIIGKLAGALAASHEVLNETRPVKLNPMLQLTFKN